jgi:pyruvate formate-lyase/glycerol dehydratase family glycyl radical enzyme
MAALVCSEPHVYTDRIRELREILRSEKVQCCAEANRLMTLAWKNSEGEPLDIRWARMLEIVLKKQAIAIRDRELIVGSQTQYVLGASPFLAFNAESAKDLENESFTIKGERKAAEVTEEDRSVILEDMKYWTGKSVACCARQRCKDVFGEKVEEILKSRIVVPVLGQAPALMSTSTLDLPKILNKGLRNIIDEIKLEIDRLTFTREDDLERHNFLKAASITLDASIFFAHRYADLARNEAKKEKGQRKQELEEIARICDKVPEFPAATFREALQSFWLIFLSNHFMSHTVPGRMDQYLYPFYLKDLQDGKLTRSQAAELLACLFIKLNELTPFEYGYEKELNQGELRPYVTIAGLTPDGKDATNELSFLILEVAGQLKLSRPSIALSCHPGISKEILMKALETNVIIGGGIPAFLNIDISATKLVNHGLSLEDARNISFGGCVHPHSSAASAMLCITNLNFTKIFELALNNGIDPKTGKQLGPATGDPRTFQSLEDVVNAFKAQYVYWAGWAEKIANVYLQTLTATCRTPLKSALTKDCISKGRDIFNGGLRYPQFAGQYCARGLQNIVNSMIAIKKYVFEEKSISMDQLMEALRLDFENMEELRQKLISAPKWGNDDDEVDMLHAELWSWTGEILKHSNLHKWLNLPIVIRRGGASWHYIAGKTCGAFPDGRKAGRPMADATVSPVGGSDKKGPTAIINSASKLSPDASLTSLFNMKFPPHLMKSDENKEKVLALIKTYFNRGGYHIQFNMIDKNNLLDAKQHPENFRDLVVRVAGFSAYFTDLAPQVQDDIISRTEQVLC